MTVTQSSTAPYTVTPPAHVERPSLLGPRASTFVVAVIVAAFFALGVITVIGSSGPTDAAKAQAATAQALAAGLDGVTWEPKMASFTDDVYGDGETWSGTTATDATGWTFKLELLLGGNGSVAYGLQHLPGKAVGFTSSTIAHPTAMLVFDTTASDRIPGTAQANGYTISIATDQVAVRVNIMTARGTLVTLDFNAAPAYAWSTALKILQVTMPKLAAGY